MQTYLTVSALTKYIKAKLEGDKHLFSIWIKGEISNFKRHSRGHLYFTLKDEFAQISAIMFARDAQSLVFPPKDGDHVLIQARISVYEPNGTYSLNVSSMEPDGIGELYLRFEALKKDYQDKGYFDLSRKKTIPPYSKRIGVVTSPTGAVIEDIKNTVERRFKLAEVHLYPALVQGPGSAESIKKMIELANMKNDVDVLIVGRGGGSMEDLWAFNEPLVVEAIFHSKIPIVAAIGHETDTTLSDYVADLRAPTPTAAAELVTPNKDDLVLKINDSIERIYTLLDQRFHQFKTQLIHLDQRLFDRTPKNQLIRMEQKVDRLHGKVVDQYRIVLLEKESSLRKLELQLVSPKERIERLLNKELHLRSRLHEAFKNIQIHKRYQHQHGMNQLVYRYNDIYAQKSHRFDTLRVRLEGLNPLSIMDRGFVVVQKDDRVMTSIDDLEIDDTITLRMKDGRVAARVMKKEKN